MKNFNKNLQFYKSVKDNRWYIRLKYVPFFLKPYLQMVAGADRLLDILYMKENNILVETEILEYYQEKNIERKLTLNVSSEKDYTNPHYDEKLKLHKYFNTEFDFNKFSHGRWYWVNKNRLYRNTAILKNEQNNYFDNLGMGDSSVYFDLAIYFLFCFSYPKTIFIKIVPQPWKLRR